ncbi:cation transporter [Oryzobacter sp. R7]|uniref:cation transporter n=1 Tax=Oryzobacter faecalis TaxID=3388656 RepID=UPI00398C9A48
MPELTLLVAGMGCRGCVRDVTARLRDVPGVERVVADADRHLVRLHGSMTLSDVLDVLARSGIDARVVGDASADVSA